MIEDKHKALIYGQIIGDFLLQGKIEFLGYGTVGSRILTQVSSACFSEPSFDITIGVNEWDEGPSEAVRRELVDSLILGNLRFKPDFDVEAICRERQFLTH